MANNRSGLGPNFATDQKQELPIVATKEGCQGGTFIVTGANTGLGYEAAKHLVQLSSKKVILAVRSPAKGDEAKAKIEADTGVKGVAEVWPLDMGSFESIKAFAEKVNGLERLDAIIENAGVALPHFKKADGNEETIMVNVLGTMLLAGLVMPKLKETAKKFGIQPHLSLVGSGVAFTVPGTLERINGDIIDGLNDESQAVMSERYKTLRAFCNRLHANPYRYPVSKLVEFYAVREYASLTPLSATGVVINYVNPGLCETELARNADDQTKKRIEDMRAALGRTAEMGSRTLLHGAVGGEGTHGKYLSECEAKE
jgi:NAD(P)-dependent dehydrogenase (short-subunit alcohol dehydrogenase family)